MAVVSLVPASAALAASEERIGGKALGLARLDAVGSRVPPWFAVPTEAFAAHLERAGAAPLLERLAELGGRAAAEQRPALEEISRDMRAAVESHALDPALASELARGLEALGPGPFAVRSSMVGEDSAEHSFAGQLDSFLFQTDVERVAASVVRCWGSAFSAHALAYLLRAGGLERGIRLGVVVQQMVRGDVSGVIFTAHPGTGRRDHALLTAAWGLCEGVVSGLCNTDEIEWDHAGVEIAARIADKDVRVVRSAHGAPGTVQEDVPDDDRRRRCLTADETRSICTEALRIARALEAPLDIEWTLDGTRLYVLQARPITSLPEPENRDGPRVVFDNSNIQESYCGVTTPLTFSFASRGYASVYAQMMRALGLPRRTIDDHRGVLRSMLGLVRGRVYYNINNWYRGLLLFPSFGQNKEDMERMMGLQDPVDFIEDEQLSAGQKLRRLPRVLWTLVRLKVLIAGLGRAVPRFLGDFEVAYRSLDRSRLPDESFSGLMDRLEQLRVGMIENWHTPIVNDFHVMMAMGSLRRLLASAKLADAGGLESDLLSGEEGIESTEPTRMLLRMAHTARETPGLAEALRHENPEAALADVRAGFPAFAETFDEYVERYGDRCMGELKLETVSLREDPSFVVQVIRNYLDRPDLRADDLSAAESRRRADAEETLRRHLSSWGRLRTTRVLRSARAAVKNRENMRLARTRMFGLHRDVYRAIGERLTEAGRLDRPRDVFYLAVEEIEAYHEGRAVTVDLAAVARLRKAEFAAYEDKDLPHCFETVGPVYHGNRYAAPPRAEPLDPERKVLRGIGCFPGVVEAPLRVILSPADELSLNGQILTTVRTDPGWAPLFPTCSGILVERGSTLSHSAVVARELGIPAVVGVADLLEIVSDGERVRLDGGEGRVELLER